MSLRRATILLAISASMSVSGCTAFALPRPAQVRPGPSLTMSVAAATPPGDAASWFWSVYCSSNCNRAMVAPAAQVMYGLADEDGIGRTEVGGGINGIVPFIEAYRRVDSGAGRALGFGGRIGALPITATSEVQLYARINLKENGARTTFLNPTYFAHFSGRYWVQTAGAVFGMHETDEQSSITLALTPSVAWSRRSDFAPAEERSAVSAFIVLSASFSLHRPAE